MVLYSVMVAEVLYRLYIALIEKVRKSKRGLLWHIIRVLLCFAMVAGPASKQVL